MEIRCKSESVQVILLSIKFIFIIENFSAPQNFIIHEFFNYLYTNLQMNLTFTCQIGLSII